VRGTRDTSTTKPTASASAPVERVGGDGEAVIEDLAPGPWRVKLEDDEGEEEGQLVEVQAGAEAFVTLTP